MKSKVLTSALLSLMLAACNDSDHDNAFDSNVPSLPTEPSTGGGTGGGGNSNSDVLSEFYTYEFNQPYEYLDDIDQVVFAAQRNQISNGVIYLDDNKDIEAEVSVAQDMLFPHYVTHQGVYRSDRMRDKDLGFKLERIIENSPNQLITRPATLTENNIESVHILKWYDLSGKAMTERTNVALVKSLNDSVTKGLYESDAKTSAVRQHYNANVKKLVNLQQTRTFPSGAKCFQVISVQEKTPFIEFDPETISGYASLDAWQEQVSYWAKNISKGTLANVEYRKAEVDQEDSYFRYFGAIQFENKIYESSFSEDSTLDDMVQYQERQIAMAKKQQASAIFIRQLEFIRDEVRDSCEGYNVVAAKAVNALLTEACK